MTFFALPSSAVLVVRVGWLQLIKTQGASKRPVSRAVDTNAIEDIIRFLAVIAGLDTNAFHGHGFNPSDLGIETFRPRNRGGQRALSFGPRSGLAKA